jgi:ATP-dependent Lon protease
MLRHSDLFEELPAAYYDSAFLDRLHFYIPGWEVDIIRGEMFSDGYGFVVDYLAEILKTLRNHDLSQVYKEHFELFSDISTRDRDAIQKTFSGLMKILFPLGEVSKDEIELLLQFAIEGRKRVKDQLMRIDSTYRDVRFGYTEVGKDHQEFVKTLEERQYPQHYYQGAGSDAEDSDVGKNEKLFAPSEPSIDLEAELKEQHLVIEENQKGISFDNLLGPYLKGATDIVITDAYIRKFHQARNLMELLETVAKNKNDDEEVLVTLITIEDEFYAEQQKQYLLSIQENVWSAGINFSWEFDEEKSIHARHIVSNNGWKILLDRGLDIFQHFDGKDAFSLASRLQEYRLCKRFEVTIVSTQ